MSHTTNSRKLARIKGKMLLLLLIAIFKSTFFLYGQCGLQYNIAIDLSNYTPGQVLTNEICIPAVQFVDPDVHVFIDGAAISTIPWLDFTTSMENSNQELHVKLFTKVGQCVPLPPGKAACGAPILPAQCQGQGLTQPACNAAGFAGADRSQCYTVTVVAYGNCSVHSLCVFLPKLMVMTGPANTEGINNVGKNLDFSNGRNDEDYKWTVDGGLPSFLTFTDDAGKDAQLQLKSSGDVAPTTFTIRSTSTKQGCDAGTFTFTVSSKKEPVFVGDPIDMFLVVDVSGSMGETAICACKGSSGCPDPPGKSKLKYLKEQINQLYAQMKTLARAEDRIGLVSFHTTSTIEKTLVPFSDPSILTLVNAWDDNGYNTTCIGCGLKDAVGQLQAMNPTHKKFIILMTNGMQNETPEIEWTDGTKSTVKVGAITFNKALGITVIPIAIFTPSGDYRDLLNALGTGTGVSVVKDVCESNLSLLTAYTTAAMSIGSPKLVTFKRDVFSGNTATGTFTVNEDLDKLLVNIINVGNQNFTSFKIEKNVSNVWTDITSLGAITPALAQSSIRRLFTMNFPAVLNGSPLNSSGDYRYTVTSSIPGIPYEFSVIIDDHGVKHFAYAGQPYDQTDRSMPLTANIYFNGSPVTNATVVVSLESPIASFSNNFSRANISGMQVTKVPLTERGKTAGFGSPYIKHITIKNAAIDALRVDGDRMNNADRKYFVLKHENNFGTVFQAQGNTITLAHQGNGSYQGQFTGTQHVGLYTMHFLITANVPGVGTITRMEEKDVFVNFGKPILDKSNLYVMWEQPILISFTPKDAHDNLLGPGHADQISIYMSKGSASAAIDYLDGKYVAKLNGINIDDDPDIIIRIRKDVLYNGKLSGLSRKRAFISINAGYDFPQGTLDSAYTSNLMFELKGGYRFWKKLGLQAHLGYYGFKGKGSNSNESIIGGGLGAFYRFPITNSQGWNMIVELNGGYYKPKHTDGAFGINGGVGFNAFLSYKLSLVLEGKYYTIYTKPDNTNFIGTTIGLKFHF